MTTNPAPSGSKKPVITYSCVDPEIAVSAVVKLLRAKEVIFNHGGRFVRVVDAPIETVGGIHTTVKILDGLDVDAMTDEIGKICDFKEVRIDSKLGVQEVRIPVPSRVARTILSRKGTGVDPLYMVTNMPMMARDGAITSAHGYDRLNGIYVDTNTAFPQVPNAPTHADALKALETLLKPFRGFPFVSDLDKAVIICAVLSGCYLSSALEMRPAIGISAKSTATGKTKLTHVVSTILEGSPTGLITAADRPEETDKRFDAQLIKGHRMVAIDNIDRPIGSAALCTALTSSYYEPRLLGSSKTVRVKSPLLILNGNNLTVDGDITRRVLMCHLDAGMPNPERREFDFDALEEAYDQRPSLAAAALTILKAFHVAGAPEMEGLVFGSYERWMKLVRDPIMWLGLPDVVTAQATSTETVAETQAREAERIDNAILNGLSARWPSVPFSSSEITDWWDRACEDWQAFDNAEVDGQFHNALFAIAQRPGTSGLCTQRLGIYLAGLAQQRTGPVWIEPATKLSGNNRWKMRSAP